MIRLDDAFGRRALGPWLALLLLPMAYWCWIRVHYDEGYFLCLEDPVASEGTPIVLSLFRVDRIDGPRAYVAEKGMRYVPVEGDTAGLLVGADISVGGTFRADGVVVEGWREEHHLRLHKKVLGLAGLGVFGLSLPLWFRVGRGGLVSRA